MPGHEMLPDRDIAALRDYLTQLRKR